MHEAFAIIQGMLMTLLEFEEFMYCKYCFVFHDMQSIFWPKIGVKDSTCTSFIPKSLVFILLSNALFFFQTNNVLVWYVLFHLCFDCDKLLQVGAMKKIKIHKKLTKDFRILRVNFLSTWVNCSYMTHGW